MAGYRESFGSNVDFAFGQGSNLGRQADIGGRIERGLSGMGQSIRQTADLRRSMQDLSRTSKQLQQDLQNAPKGSAEWRRLNSQLKDTSVAMDRLSRSMRQVPFQLMEKGFGGIVKGLLKLNVASITSVFGFLIDSIKRVYELQERWTKAIGAFNMRMGGLTSGLKGATQAATRWSGVVRGLTDGDIQEGIELFGEFTEAIGRVVKKGDDFEKLGLQLARGFNLGGSGAGQLAKVFGNIGTTGGDAAKVMSELAEGANLAGVPVNMLAKDVSEASEYMARFGTEGSRGFVTAAAYARKFTIAMKDLQRVTERFDMFDDAIETVSKLNTAFGTTINSLDLMLEDDPAARMEQIRQSFLAQGLTFDRMTVKQRRLAADTLQVTDDQLASLLNLKNAGVSYGEFQAKQLSHEKSERDAKKQMEFQLRKTAQTMYAFGAAFDRVTVAIANAIKPLLVVFGLAKDGDKKFTSFGQVMEGVTETVEDFFNSLARNEKWQLFMRELAKDLMRLGHGLKEWVSSGRAAEAVGTMAKYMKDFYVFARDAAIWMAKVFGPPVVAALRFAADHFKAIAAAWAVLKVGNKAMALQNFVGDLGIGGGGRTRSQSIKSGASAYTGGGVGGALKSVGGFVGIGLAVSELISAGIDYFFPREKTSIEVARDELAKTIERETAVRNANDQLLMATQARQAAHEKQREYVTGSLLKLDKDARKTKGTINFLDSDELRLARQRADELVNFSGTSKTAREAIDLLRGGVAQLTDKQIAALIKASGDYQANLNGLNAATEKQLEIETAKLQSSQLGEDKAALEGTAKLLDAQLAAAKAQVGPEGDRFTVQLGAAEETYTAEEIKNQHLEGILTKSQMARYKKQLDADAIEKKVIDARKALTVKEGTYAEQLFRIQMRAELMKNDIFTKAQMANPMSDPEKLLDVLINSGDFTQFNAEQRRILTSAPQFAAGGIVSRPTYAMVGENGPEAVVPLRASSRPRARSIMRAAGIGSMSSGGTQVVSSTADVYLDGQKVGGAIVRTMISGRE